MYLAEFVLVLRLPEVFVHVVQGTEVEGAACAEAYAFALIVGEGHPLHVATLAHALRLLIFFGHAVDCAVPYAYEG